MIKAFTASTVTRLEKTINEYAQDNKLKIISVSITGVHYIEALVVFEVNY